MSLTSSSIANLINGVSQQPHAIRLPSQAQAQENCFSSVVEGLKRRPNTTHLAKVYDGTLPDAFTHLIDRDSSEQYEVILAANELSVYDLTGVAKTVNYAARTKTMIQAAGYTTTGSATRIYQPAAYTTVTLDTTGTFVGTVLWEKSSTGAFAGEETTVRTDTAAATGAVAWTNGDYLRARVSSYTSGTITCTSTYRSNNYLQTAAPSASFRAITIADYTFLVNNTVVAAMLDDLSVANDRPEALVFVKQASYNTTYSVLIDGAVEGTYTTAGSGVLSTTAIAIDLQTDLATNLGVGYGVSRYGSTIHIQKYDNTAIDIEAQDSQAGTVLKAYSTQVQRFADLPTVAPANFTIEVVGDASSSFDNYFVTFVPNTVGSTAPEEGVWVEGIKTGIPYKLDGDTMPHILVREADGTFTFGQATWGDRIVGDETSAATPSFVGRTINDLVLYKNRLCALASENVIATRAGEFFEFFRSTVTTLLDSDPIDVASGHNKVSVLRSAIPFDGKLLLFSDKTQFTFSGGDLLTPKTATIDLVTEYTSLIGCQPVNAGDNVYFSTAKGAYSGMQEYYVGDDNKYAATDISAHVPTYLSGTTTHLSAALDDNVIVALTDERDALYPYKFYWNKREKLQSAWSRWSFNGATILSADFVGSNLYLLIQYADGVHLETLSVTANQLDPFATYLTHLDRRITEDECSLVAYDAGTNRTTWTLPYAVNSAATYAVVTRSVEVPTINAGVRLQSIVATGTSISASGNHASSPVWIGEGYESLYEFSKPYLREESPGGGLAVVAEGRLQILSWSVVVNDTGYFEAVVTHAWRDEPDIHRFTGRVLGSVSNTLGTTTSESRTVRFPVLAKNTETSIVLRSSSHLPFFFVSAEWEADYNRRSARLGNRSV